MLKGAQIGAATLAAAAVMALGGGAQAQVALVASGDSYFVDVRSIRDIPFRTVVRQQYDYSCGSAALATLLTHHYGTPTTEGKIFRAMYEVGDQAKIRAVGFSLLDMKQFLESQGYKANGYRLSLSQLEKLRSPAISVVQVGSYRHFVVIKGVKDGRILVGDPALGLKIYTFAEFESLWNGIAFVVTGPEGRTIAYNREDEWRPFAYAPVDQPLSDRSMAAFDRQLRPIYQVLPVAELQAGVLR